VFIEETYIMFTSLNPGALSFSVPVEQALDLARMNGFGGLDVSLAELGHRATQTSVEDVKATFDQAGVRPGAWSLPVDFRADDEIYRAGLADLPGYARLAQALGSPWCFTWILPFSDTVDASANMAYHVDRLRPIARILADHGCRLGLEFVGPATMRAGHQYAFIHTIDGALELGQRIGTGNTGLLLDCWHWYTSHATVADIDRLSADQVVYVHVNDAPPDREVDAQIDTQRLLPGASGVIDIVGFLQALARIGYDGPVAVEPFNAAVTALPPADRVCVAGESLRAVWTRAGLPTES